MRLFDTHCHFETTDASRIAPVLERARAAGVESLVAVGGSAALNAAACAARDVAAADPTRFPRVFTALGYDRDQIAADRTPLAALLAAGPVAVGEIGLDYHYAPETREDQMRLFAEQLEAARAADLPVVIHTREAAEDTAALLTQIPSRGIIHCFTGTPDEARRYLDLGFFISISGIVTFRAADNVRETARVIPDDRLLIETDSPYLAPVPMRGQANEPAFVSHTCEFLARERGTSAAELAALTFANAERAFGC